MSTPPLRAEVSADDMRRLITTAVLYYDQYGDDHDVLSSSQVEVVERLRPLADDWSGEEPPSPSCWDGLSIMTTAIELTDIHGIDEEDLHAAAERARVYVEVDDA